MKATELEPGQEYYYIGSSLREPERRAYVAPLPDHTNAFVFVGDKYRTYTLFGPDLWFLHQTEGEAWLEIGMRLRKEGAVCIERARQLLEN